MIAATTRKTALFVSVLSLSVLGACSGRPIADATAGDTAGRVVRDDRYSERVCLDCGTVRSITAVSTEGDTTGVGAVVGAIVGGVAGHQIGGGRGQDIATVAGAVGGAVVGNEIEQRRNTDRVYDVRIEMDNGSERTITVADTAGLRVGDDVTVQGNDIALR